MLSLFEPGRRSQRARVAVQNVFLQRLRVPLKSRVRLALGASFLLALAFGACDWFEDPAPDVIRITLEGDARPFVVITSTEFFATSDDLGDLAAQVFVADTIRGPLPFDRNWNIKEEQRFYMVAVPADSTTTVTVRVQVFLDDEQAVDNTVQAGPGNPILYMYLFNQHVLQDFELL